MNGLQSQVVNDQDARTQAFESIKKKVEQNQNVVVVRMEELRDAIGKQKLGKWVVKDIDRELRAIGLAYYPKELPMYQDEPVMVYRQGSQVEAIVNAVLNPTEENVQVLRQVANNEDTAVLDQVRQLVCR